MRGLPSRITFGLVVVATALGSTADLSLAQSGGPADPLFRLVNQTLATTSGDLERTVNTVLDIPGALLTPAERGALEAARPSPPGATEARDPGTGSATSTAAQPRAARVSPALQGAKAVAEPTPSAGPPVRAKPRKARQRTARVQRAKNAPSATQPRRTSGPRRPSRAPAQPRRAALRVFIDSIPGWIKVALIVVSAFFVLSLIYILMSRRQLADALSRAHHDVVTGLPNRAAVDDALDRMTAQAARREAWLGVVMLDIDHFKSINDAHGHARGDEVLAAIGSMARTAVRAGDFVGRFGGEELMVLLPDTDEAGARRVAEKLRLEFRQTWIRSINRTVTASFGVSAGRGDRHALYGLVATADAALYRAKANGRDRTETASAAAGMPVPA